MKRILVLAVLIVLLIGCTPSAPIECNDKQARDILSEAIKRDLATKTYMLTQQAVNPDNLKLTIESIKTLSKDSANPFYRKCAVSFSMPGMMFPVRKIYEIDKDESGDIVVRFTI